jgi:hypothetical protein
LAAFGRVGDGEESRTLLARALADNEHVPSYLLGERPLPKLLPPYISPGDEDEAIYYCGGLPRRLDEHAGRDRLAAHACSVTEDGEAPPGPPITLAIGGAPHAPARFLLCRRRLPEDKPNYRIQGVPRDKERACFQNKAVELIKKLGDHERHQKHR